MNSFELNKIAGAVLAALLVVVASRTFFDIAATPHRGGEHEVVGYELPKPEGAKPEGEAKSEEPAAAGETAPAKTAADGEAPAAEAAAPAAKEAPPKGFDAAKVASLVGGASAETGAKLYKKCKACHTVKQGGANKVGPALWGIAGRAKGSVDDFKYSDAMKAKGGNWDNEALAHFLYKPKQYIKGTKMVFKGFSKDGDLADIVAYLNTLK